MVPTCILLVCQGCQQEPFDYVQVSGTVKYEDETLIPAARINVTFISQSDPVDPKTHPRPGTAAVNVEDGSFDTVTSHKYGDGIVVGRHKVLITAFDAMPEGQRGHMLNPSNVIPPEYRAPNATPLEVDANDSPFTFRVRRP